MAQGEGYITIALKDRKFATGTTAPQSPSPGDSWYDEGNNVLKHWNGERWVFDKYKQFGNIQETLRSHGLQIQENADGITQLISDITMEIVDGKPVYIKQAYNSLKNTVDVHEQEIYSYDNNGRKISRITQTADQIALMVEDGTGSSGLTLKPGMLSAIAKNIDLRGNTVFSKLTDEIVRNGENITVINGDMIQTGTIDAKRIDVKGIFAENIEATGTITGATIVGGNIDGVAISGGSLITESNQNKIIIKNGLISIEDKETTNDNKTGLALKISTKNIYTTEFNSNGLTINNGNGFSALFRSNVINMQASSLNQGFNVTLANGIILYNGDHRIIIHPVNGIICRKITCSEIIASSTYVPVTIADKFSIDQTYLSTCKKILDTVILNFRIKSTDNTNRLTENKWVKVASLYNSEHIPLYTTPICSIISNVSGLGSNCGCRVVGTNTADSKNQPGDIEIFQYGSTPTNAAFINITYKI